MINKDVLSGLVFATVGLFYGAVTLQSLKLGSLMDMGPGSFPLVLSICLIGIGAAVAVRGSRDRIPANFKTIPWRAIICLSGGILFFATFVEDVGLFPAVFVLTVASSLAMPAASYKATIFISLCISTFCSAVFIIGVGLPIPVISPLLSF